MIKRILILFLLLIVFLVLLLRHREQAKPDELSYASDNSFSISNPDSIIDPISSFLIKMNDSILKLNSETFNFAARPDISDFFEISKCLSYDSAYSLDYVYINGSNPFPVVYMRNKDATPFDSLEQLYDFYSLEIENCDSLLPPGAISFLDAQFKGLTTSSIENEYQGCLNRNSERYVDFTKRRKEEAFNFVILQAEPDALFELASFRYLSESFGRKWHSLYGLKYIFTNKDTAEKTVRSLTKQSSDEIKEGLQLAIDTLVFTPKIKIEDDHVEASFICYEFGTGLFHRTDIMENKAPFSIVNVEEKLIAAGYLGYMM